MLSRPTVESARCEGEGGFSDPGELFPFSQRDVFPRRNFLTTPILVQLESQGPESTDYERDTPGSGRVGEDFLRTPMLVQVEVQGMTGGRPYPTS